MVAVIIGREFAVTGLRNLAYARGLTMPASGLGKLKMVSQVMAILLLILGWERMPLLLLAGAGGAVGGAGHRAGVGGRLLPALPEARCRSATRRSPTSKRRRRRGRRRSADALRRAAGHDHVAPLGRRPARARARPSRSLALLRSPRASPTSTSGRPSVPIAVRSQSACPAHAVRRAAIDRQGVAVAERRAGIGAEQDVGAVREVGAARRIGRWSATPARRTARGKSPVSMVSQA